MNEDKLREEWHVRTVNMSQEVSDYSKVERMIADWWLQKMSEQEAHHQEVLEEIATKIDRLGRKTVEHFSPTRSISQGIVKSLSDAVSIVRSYKK